MDASHSRGGSSSSSSSSSSGGGANRRGSRGRGGGGSYRGARGGGGGGRGGSYRGGRGGGRGGGFRGGRGGGFQQRGIIQRYVSSVKPTELAVEQATQLSTVVYLPKNNRRLVAADGEAGNAFRQLCDDGDHFSPDDVRGFLPEERDNEALPAILPASLVPLDHARFGQLLRDVYRDLQTTGDALHFRIRLGTLRLPNLETLQARQFTVSDADVALRDNKGSFKGTFSDDVVFFEDAQLEDSEQEFERMKESVHELLTGAFGADAVEEGKRDLRNSLHFYTGDKMAQKFVVHYDPGTGEFHSEETISTERVSQRDIVVLGSPLDLRIALTRDTVGVEINVDETIRVLREHHLHDFETLVQTHHLPPEIRFNCVREEHHRTYCVSPSPEEREQWGADVLLVVLKHVVQKEPGQRTKYNINVTVYSTLINESRARRVLREGEELRPWSLNSVFHEALRALSLAYSLAPNLIL